MYYKCDAQFFDLNISMRFVLNFFELFLVFLPLLLVFDFVLGDFLKEDTEGLDLGKEGNGVHSSATPT